jgi:hypothetical protein
MKAVACVLLVVACALSVSAMDLNRLLKKKSPVVQAIAAGSPCKVPRTAYSGVCSTQRNCKNTYIAGANIKCDSKKSQGCCYVKAAPTPRPNSGGNGGSGAGTGGSNSGGSGSNSGNGGANTGGNGGSNSGNGGSNAGGNGGSAGSFNPSNPLSVTKSRNPVALKEPSDKWCTGTRDTARKEHANFWVKCLAMTDAKSVQCMWSIEDEQCVSRSDTNNLGILEHALRYEAAFVTAHYTAAPVTYVDLADPASVQTFSPIGKAPFAGNCNLARDVQTCLQSCDDLTSGGDRCIWSIEDAACVSKKDTTNVNILAHAMAYPSSFVLKHYAMEAAFPKLPTCADLGKPLSVKRSSSPKAIAEPSDKWCTGTKATARKEHANYWVKCHAMTDAASVQCMWSIEDEQCVSRTADKTNTAIVINALRYNTAFVEAHYKADPVTYVDLKDPQSVQTFSPIGLNPSGSQCTVNRDPNLCLIDADELAPGMNCVWSIEDAGCVSRNDAKNVEVVKHAMAYPPQFVKDHYKQ